MLLEQGILAVEGDRMEVEIEREAMGQAQRACGSCHGASTPDNRPDADNYIR